jgi:hypothetical protein
LKHSTVREEWEKIFLKSKNTPTNAGISIEFQANHKVKTQSEDENRYSIRTFLVIVGKIVFGLKRSLKICNFLKSFALWGDQGLDENLRQECAEEISNEMSD